MSPNISITTPVLNGARYLGETIASIRNQTYSDLEYLIVDGGSVDGSIEIAEAAARDDHRIRVLSLPGEGQYAAIAEGFRQGRGDWFAWLNADDLYAPWAFASLAAYARRHPGAQWVSGLPACWSADGVLQFVRPEAVVGQAFIRWGWRHKDLLGFIQQESVFFRRALFDELTEAELAAFVSARLAGDFILWKTFARRNARLETIPALLGGFRRHDANRSILGMSAYMNEARAHGAVELPAPLAHVARAIYGRLAAERLRRLVAEADAASLNPSD